MKIKLHFSRLYRYGVLRKDIVEYRPGYLDPFDVSHQYFYRDLYLQAGKLKIKLRRKVLFVEEVPQPALIDQGIFGETYWRSDCPTDLFTKCDKKTEEAA